MTMSFADFDIWWDQASVYDVSAGKESILRSVVVTKY